MSENARMLAFTEKVNLPLFGDVTHFILNAADASHEQINHLACRCVLFDPEQEPGSIQEKYGMKSALVCRCQTCGPLHWPWASQTSF